MKKGIISCLLLFSLFSCSENEIFDAEENNSNLKYSTLMNGDGKYDVLGFSYDITGEYLDVDNAKKTIIDIDAFVRDYPDRVYTYGVSKGDLIEYAGATAYELLEDIRTKNDIKIDTNTGIESLSLTGNINKITELTEKHSYSNKYSFARADAVKRVKRIYIYATPDVLRNYLKPTFIEDIKKLPPLDLIKEYGTHILCDITIGGKLTFLQKAIITEESNTFIKTEIMKNGIKFDLSEMGISGSSESEKEQLRSWKNKISFWESRLIYFGGEGSGRSYTFNSETGYLSSSTINLDSWEKSVNAQNSGLIEINWERTYPIYEFVSDPFKKATLKLAVIAYTNSKKLEVINEEIIPMHDYWTSKHNDHMLTINRNDTQGTPYEYYGIECYVNKNPTFASVELHDYWSPKHSDHMLSIHKIDNKDNSGGYIYCGVMCHVYPIQFPGTVPVHSYFSPRVTDHMYTTKRNDAEHVRNGYLYEGVAFYAYR